MGSVVSFTSSSSTAADSKKRIVSMEDGYTGVAHVLLEELMQSKHKFSGREFCIILTVIRKTYGYKKSADWIALSQFVELTGLKRQHCSNLINGLVARKVLSRKTIGNDQKLAINCVVNEWVPFKCKKTALPNPVTNAPNPVTNAPNPVTTNNKDKDKDIPLQTIVPTKVETHKKPRRYKFTVADRNFAEHMAAQIDLANGITDRARNLDSWANDLRIMREIDGRSEDEIFTVFTWANQDQFWKYNIQSVDKLRSQFSKLYGKCQSEGNFRGLNGENNNSANQQRNARHDPLTDISWMDEC